MDISIIIPIYNEEKNIPSLFENLQNVLTKNSYSHEIVFVDDGSQDNSHAKLLELENKYPIVNIIKFKRNFGQTAAIMAGIENSQGDIIVTMDGDLQNDPKDIPLLIDKLHEGFDVCSGWRKKRKDNWIVRTLPSMVANAIISKIAGVHLNDYGCTLKAYKREFIGGVKLYGEMHRFIPIYAVWQGAKVTEIPVTHHPRKHGRSKYGLERIFKVILDLIVIKFLSSYSQKPIYIFGGFGLLNIFLSFISFAFMGYFKIWGGKTFVETPLPQLVVLFFSMGFISILMGLVAEIQMRTYYESQNKPSYLIDNQKNNR